MYKIIGADGKEYGPITTEVLRQWVNEGRANGQSKVLPAGATEWTTIADLPELASLLGGIPASVTTPGPIAAPMTPRNNSYAVAAVTLGVLSITLGICCCYGLPFSIPGIVCASVALSQINRNPGAQQGKGLAITGLVLSICGIALAVLLISLGVAMRTPEMLRRIQRL